MALGAAPDRRGAIRWTGGCEEERWLTGVPFPRRMVIMHLTSNALDPSKARARAMAWAKARCPGAQEG